MPPPSTAVGVEQLDHEIEVVRVLDKLDSAAHRLQHPICGGRELATLEIITLGACRLSGKLPISRERVVKLTALIRFELEIIVLVVVIGHDGEPLVMQDPLEGRDRFVRHFLIVGRRHLAVAVA